MKNLLSLENIVACMKIFKFWDLNKGRLQIYNETFGSAHVAPKVDRGELGAALILVTKMSLKRSTLLVLFLDTILAFREVCYVEK